MRAIFRLLPFALAATWGCSQDGPEPPARVDNMRSDAMPVGALRSDAGVYASAKTPNKVPCQERGQDCALPADVCCGIAKFQSDDAGAPRTDASIVIYTSSFVGWNLSCSAIASCQGDLELACDGPEDCPAGEACCFKQGAEWEFKTACRAACGAASDEAPGLLAQVCHDHADCTRDFPACCSRQVPDAGADPYGFCFTLEAVSKMSPAISCDIP